MNVKTRSVIRVRMIDYDRRSDFRSMLFGKTAPRRALASNDRDMDAKYINASPETSSGRPVRRRKRRFGSFASVLSRA